MTSDTCRPSAGPLSHTDSPMARILSLWTVEPEEEAITILRDTDTEEFALVVAALQRVPARLGEEAFLLSWRWMDSDDRKRFGDPALVNELGQVVFAPEQTQPATFHAVRSAVSASVDDAARHQRFSRSGSMNRRMPRGASFRRQHSGDGSDRSQSGKLAPTPASSPTTPMPTRSTGSIGLAESPTSATLVDPVAMTQQGAPATGESKTVAPNLIAAAEGKGENSIAASARAAWAASPVTAQRREGGTLLSIQGMGTRLPPKTPRQETLVRTMIKKATLHSRKPLRGKTPSLPASATPELLSTHIKARTAAAERKTRKRSERRRPVFLAAPGLRSPTRCHSCAGFSARGTRPWPSS